LIAVLSAVLAAAVLITGFWQPGFFLNAKTGGVLSAPYAGNSAAFSAMPCRASPFPRRKTRSTGTGPLR
jgi:hypothetical protein